MTPERWKRIEELFHEAHAMPPPARASFLAACEDEQLRREVEALLSDAGSADDFLRDRPLSPPPAAGEAAGGSMCGRTLGAYQLETLLGTGGMGEVYRARDTTLGRTVAIKVLPAAWSRDPDRLARFEREARMLAALNHPNVCAIHGLEEAGGIRYLVLEMLEGLTLAATLAHARHEIQAGLPLATALSIARQIADALDAAHERGIIHRDLTPANIVITADGVVKVLDFGLAMTGDAHGPTAGSGLMRTEAAQGNGTGLIVGTAAYMSPEQARGAPVDKRTDIWAFGCVLFEMLTGHVAFAGTTIANTIQKILDHDPDWSALPLATPAPVQRLVLRCLVKDRKKRLRDIGDARIELDSNDDAARERAGGQMEVLPRATSLGMWMRSIARRRRMALVGVTALLMATVLVVKFKEPNGTKTAGGPFAATFMRLTSHAGVEQHPSLSADGRWLVYAARADGTSHIFLQSVGGQNRIDLTPAGTDDSQPSFSPDTELIAFRSAQLGGGIFVMGRTGEFRRRVTSGGYNPSWSPDGREILFSTVIMTTNPYNRTEGISGVHVVRVSDGVRREIYSGDAVQPAWSPHGHRIAFWTVRYGQRDLWTIPAAGGEPLAVTQDVAVDFNPVWSSDGRHLLFASDRGGTPNLWRVPVDEITGIVVGPPESLTTNSSWVADLTTSADGRRIAYTSLVTSSNIQQFDFDPVRRAMTSAGRWVTTGSAFRKFMDVSPDGGRLVVSSGVQQEDLFVIDLAAGGSPSRAATGEPASRPTTQITNDAALDRRPSWSPDGGRIAFESTRSGSYQIWTANADGSDLRALTEDPEFTFVYHAWSPNGDRMFTTSTTAWTPLIIDPRVAWKDQKPQRLPQPSSKEFSATSWSPDGRRIVGWTVDGITLYDVESRTYDVVTHDRGMLPQWVGSHLVLYPRGSSLMLLDTVSRTSREILSAAPEVIRYVAASRDGRRIFIARGAEEADIWMASLK